MDYGKLSPTLAAALADFETGGRPALALHARTLGLVSTEVVSKPPRIVVFVHCDEDAESADLAVAGVEINQPERTGVQGERGAPAGLEVRQGGRQRRAQLAVVHVDPPSVV
ncbi:MAG TPA: hypothetical protein VNT52_13050, partial [Acidimicrobiales bacterium]|nr:hypothetical protein [Acidimicrobiales bacterium]